MISTQTQRIAIGPSLTSAGSSMISNASARTIRLSEGSILHKLVRFVRQDEGTERQVLKSFQAYRGPSWLHKVHDQLTAWEVLDDSWDGAGAARPSILALRNARALVSSFNEFMLEPDNISPSVIGGVGLTFAEGALEVFVEILNSGEVFAAFIPHTTDSPLPPRAFRVDPSTAGFEELAKEIADHLHA